MKKGKATGRPAPVYNYGYTRQPTIVTGESMTRQSEAASTDVNNIVRKYSRTGVIDHLQRAEGVYQDVSMIGSYQEAMQTVQQGRDAFLRLPSGLRSHFGNDPASYIDWSVNASQEDREALYEQITGVSRDQDANPTVDPTPASPEPETPAE